MRTTCELKIASVEWVMNGIQHYQALIKESVPRTFHLLHTFSSCGTSVPQLKHNCLYNLRVTGIVRPKEIWTSDETFNIFLTWVTVLLSQLSNQSFPHVYSARLRPISPSVDYLDNRPPINFSRVWFWLIGLSRSATYETLQYYFDHRMGRGGRHNDFACGRKTRVFLFCFNALRWRPRTSVGRTPAG